MIDVELDDAMADLLSAAAGQVDGTLLGSWVHPVGADADVWRGPAMTRLCDKGWFEFRERPRPHYALTGAGWVEAHRAA